MSDPKNLRDPKNSVVGWEACARGLDMLRIAELARATGHIFDLDYELWIAHLRAAGGDDTTGLQGKTLCLKIEPECVKDSRRFIDTVKRCPHVRRVQGAGASIHATIQAGALEGLTPETVRAFVQGCARWKIGTAVDIRSAPELDIVEKLLPPATSGMLKIRDSVWKSANSKSCSDRF